jgi:hypothetical protein
MKMNLDPRIGKLISGQFYCFAQGYANPETIGTLREVEVALGIRESFSFPVTKALRKFEVTVTPVMLTYGSHGVNGEYKVEVYAKNRNAAITEVRQKHNEVEGGRFGVLATYRAVLAK